MTAEHAPSWAAPVTLHAERLPGAIRYRLEALGSDSAPPTQEFFTHAITDAEIAALQETALKVLRSRPSASFGRDALDAGRLLCAALIPERLRPQVDAIRGPLLVSTTLLGLPFELLATDDLWGLRYAVGRRILLERPAKPIRARASRQRRRALIVASDPRGDLPFVHHETEQMFRALAPLADVYVLSGCEATIDAVATRLGGDEPFDLIHYCGHVVRDGAGASGLLLAEERVLSGPVIERTLSGSPIVFLNGCTTTRSDGPTADRLWDEDVSSVTYGFLFGGARAVVGTLTDVADTVAAPIAIELCRRALDGAPLGEALRAARAHGRAISPESPSWLSFVLYGDPTVRLENARFVPPPIPPPPIAQGPKPSARRRRAWFGITAVAVVIAAIVVAAVLIANSKEAGVRARAYAAAIGGAVDEPSRLALLGAADFFADRQRYGAELWFRERALGLTEKLCGPSAPNTAIQQNNLGYVYLKLGDGERSRPLLEHAVATLEATGAKPARLALAMSNLGMANRLTRDFARSAHWYRRALRLHRRLPKRTLAILFINLGNLERRRGRVDAARGWYRRALRVYEKMIGTRNSGYVTALNNICVLEADIQVQRFDRAEAACWTALHAARAYFPVGHPDRAEPKANLVEVLRHQGRHNEADRLERERD